MTFKDLKTGYPIHLLDRNSLTYNQAKVMAIGMPHTDRQSFSKMLVDITIQNNDGKQNTYSVAETESIAYANNLLITTDKEFVINEVRAINTQAEETLSKVDELKSKVNSCKNLLAELDTSYKDKQETEKRFRTIEEKMDKILSAISKGITNTKF